jgi:hypothetical protein
VASLLRFSVAISADYPAFLHARLAANYEVMNVQK